MVSLFYHCLQVTQHLSRDSAAQRALPSGGRHAYASGAEALSASFPSLLESALLELPEPAAPSEADADAGAEGSVASKSSSRGPMMVMSL